MINLSNMFNKCFIQIYSKNSIELIKKAQKEYENKNIMLLFFHYDNSKIIEDYNLIKHIEKTLNFNINYIDISKLYEEQIRINNIFKFIPNVENGKEIRNHNILTEITNNIKDNIIKYYNILEYKGI